MPEVVRDPAEAYRAPRASAEAEHARPGARAGRIGRLRFVCFSLSSPRTTARRRRRCAWTAGAPAWHMRRLPSSYGRLELRPTSLLWPPLNGLLLGDLLPDS